jgi:GT2 family glycosyltransferase
MAAVRTQKVSIIIPLKNVNPYINESVGACLALDYADFEVIVLPDDQSGGFDYADDPKVRVLPTGPIGPSEKRDIGAREAAGTILAFIDDDAYPVKEWLSAAVRHFENPDVAAVGGPGVTPDSDAPHQQASGLVYESLMASGNCAYRYRPMQERYVDDYPSCNFIIRKDVFEQVGGFDSAFYPGEDTVLCLKVTKQLKKKIVYEPGAVVYHHRRALFAGHLKQVANYAVHRGYFVRKFPQTSLRPAYFIPTFFVVGVVLGPLFFLINTLYLQIYFGIIFIYLFCAVFCSFPAKNAQGVLLVFLGIIATNVTYGIMFLKGLFAQKLKEEKV